MLNADRLDFDGRLDFSRLEPVAELTRHAASDPARPDEILERLTGQAVVINKEMPISADLIAAFPPSVKLICEAGTGFNNIALEAASKRGIAVANLPTYATEAMAHIAITMVMALSCSLAPQMRYLARYDRAHVERCHLGGMAHFELTDCTLGLVGGLGTIGLRVAAMAQALGMRVIASSRTCHPRQSREGRQHAALRDRGRAAVAARAYGGWKGLKKHLDAPAMYLGGSGGFSVILPSTGPSSSSRSLSRRRARIPHVGFFAWIEASRAAELRSPAECALRQRLDGDATGCRLRACAGSLSTTQRRSSGARSVEP